MLEWIPAFADKATAFVPRFSKVPPTFRMVKWKRCKEATLHGPGIVWYWPLITEVEEVDIRYKSTITHVQSITMADGTSVSARAMMLWKPSDPLLAVGENEDYQDRAADTMLSCVVDVLSTVNREQLRLVGALNFALTQEASTQLAECGLLVKRCKFSELVVSPAFRLINDAA